MTVECVACDNFSLREAGNMAKHGFGNCKSGEPWVFQSATKPKDCAHFTPAEKGRADERRAWIEKQQAQMRQKG